MKHFYQDIQGWFTFPTVYRRLVELSEGESHFVEVGAWKGKSCAYMAVEILNSGKPIRFDIVDTFKGSEEHIDENSTTFEPVLKETGSIRTLFDKNMEPVLDSVNVLEMDSLTASKMYEDNSLDFIFIDAAHDYESVKQDINSWFSKVKNDGIFAGHDAFYPPVAKAVQEFASEKQVSFVTIEDCWIFDLTHVD
jgi:hypothetical protein